MLDPVVDCAGAMARAASARLLAVVFGLLGALGAGATFLWPQIDSVLMKVPEGTEHLRRTFRQQRRVQGDSAIERIQAAARAVDSAAAEAGTPATKSPGVTRVEIEQPWRVSDMLWTGGLGALGILGQAVTVLFLTIFLLYEDDSFKRKLVAQMESHNSKRITVRILNDIAAADPTLYLGAGTDLRCRGRRDMAGAAVVGDCGADGVGCSCWRAERRSVLRAADRDRRTGDRRLPPVRYIRDGRSRGRRRPRHYDYRGHVPDASSPESRRVTQSRRHLPGDRVLELGMGRTRECSSQCPC